MYSNFVSRFIFLVWIAFLGIGETVEGETSLGRRFQDTIDEVSSNWPTTVQDTSIQSEPFSNIKADNSIRENIQVSQGIELSDTSTITKIPAEDPMRRLVLKILNNIKSSPSNNNGSEPTSAIPKSRSMFNCMMRPMSLMVLLRIIFVGIAKVLRFVKN